MAAERRLGSALLRSLILRHASDDCSNVGEKTATLSTPYILANSISWTRRVVRRTASVSARTTKSYRQITEVCENQPGRRCGGEGRFREGEINDIKSPAQSQFGKEKNGGSPSRLPTEECPRGRVRPPYAKVPIHEARPRSRDFGHMHGAKLSVVA
jgi:hypothetical protein